MVYFYIFSFQVISKFDPEGAASIRQAQTAMEGQEIIHALAFISAHFYDLPPAIKTLEKKGLPLVESVDVIEKMKSKEIPGSVGIAFSNKLGKILKRNPGFKTMEGVAKVLQGEACNEDIPWGPIEMAAMKFAPMTSCNVERSFSTYKCILRDNRKSFTVEHLSMHIVVNCNSRR